MIPDHHLITWLTFVPLIGAAVILMLRKEAAGWIKLIAMATALVAFAMVCHLGVNFQPLSGRMQFEQKALWIPTMNVWYHVGVDGISILLVILTAIVVPLAILASWSVKDNVRMYFALILAQETGVIGAFTALDFFHWFIYWELSLVPAFFLIKMWGGERAHKAATKFFIFTLVGSVTMLLAFQAIYLATGTFSFEELAALGRSGELADRLSHLTSQAGLDWDVGTTTMLALGGILLAFVVKAPLWPFHTWLPETYAEAPAPISMLLTALMSKLGVYGVLRIVVPIFPQYTASIAEAVLLLVVATIVLGAFAAYAQTDLKRMIAYSSVNHVGYCMLGIFAALALPVGEKPSVELRADQAAALNGAILQMFNHGITAAALFFFLGVLEERTRQRGLDDFGGLRQVAPIFCGLFGITLFASLGLPGLNGFVSEFLIFKGVLALNKVAAAVSLIGIVVTALFLLLIMQRVWWGPLNERHAKLGDLTGREEIIAMSFVAIMVFVGLNPWPFINMSDATVGELVRFAFQIKHAN